MRLIPVFTGITAKLAFDERKFSTKGYTMKLFVLVLRAITILPIAAFAGGNKLIDGFFMGVQSGIWAQEMRLSITSGNHVEKQNYWRNSVIAGVRLKPCGFLRYFVTDP